MATKTWVDVLSEEIRDWRSIAMVAGDRAIRALTTIWDIVNAAEQAGLITADEHHDLVSQIRCVVVE